MLSIRPGHSADNVLGHLNYALSLLVTARNEVSAGQVHGFNAYNAWATSCRRTLGPSISDADFTALVASPRYWSLQTVDPASYGQPLMDVLMVELDEREQAMKSAHEELRLAIQQWSRSTYMVVVDTNFLMWHHSELKEFDWHGHLAAEPHYAVIVWIPIAVVEQLDNLKQDRGVMRRGEKDYSRRTLARQSLRTLREMFTRPGSVVRHVLPADVPGTNRKRLEFRLLMDEAGHVRMPKVDQELIELTAGLAAVSTVAVLVTYDSGLALNATYAGAESILLVEDEPDEPLLVSPIGPVRPGEEPRP